MSCGIYKIQNLINGLLYIGQSINIEERIKKHRYSKDNTYLHRAIQKYGWKNFSTEIIEQCDSKELNEKQIYWIEYYDSITPNGYNMIPGGSNGAGLAKGKQIEQYSLSGQFIKIYPSANQAGLQNNINTSNIISCCNQKRNQAGLFQWKWKNSNKKIVSIEGNYYNDTILQYSLQGQFLKQYQSLEEVCQLFNISKSLLSNVCKGKQLTAVGFQWKYKHSNKIINNIKQQKYKRITSTQFNHGGINQFDKQGNFIAYYISALQAKRQTGVNNSNIGECCKGKRKTAGGYIWRYAN